ncbi:glycosyltransferase family 4 protein [Calothrix sp. UHCC 0171]|uniref:glycosyltransferase family 4 protein n=1 Tax=Calothrix sp. UHCC 0171 TaxID=3110245 RepID=UPI002B1FBF32|nr:glycosyltransferase family 4 protein [Calothrix sp. UHCC 0171]MEA5570392.1 glycosyltransferase family 4 protein [Calothrix sp. UHCC 0171]
MKRFISIQNGARRNYAIPIILQQAGLLEAFYTDLCANSGIGRILDRFCPDFVKNDALNRLLNRRVPSLIQDKVHTFDLVALRYLARQKLAGNNTVKQYQSLFASNHEFGQAMIRKGLGKATHIYSMFGEGTDFLEYAKQKQIKIFTEIYISPIIHTIVQREREEFHDLEPLMAQKIIEQDYTSFQRFINLTDIFIVPSSFVVKGLQEFGVSPEKCQIVPYAVGDSWFKLKNNPQKNRILFVGTAELRKGIHILGMAAKKLSHRNYEFRVAGGVSDIIRNHKLTEKINFVGRVPRSQIHQEFMQADIFVLPTLVEGSAEVVYEALAAGLPVITTEAAGSVIRDGIEGFIIPERNSEILANRIEELLENRELRDRMAIAARERAKDFTWDKYAERVINVVNS